MLTINGRELRDIEIDGIDHRDHPDYCDAYISAAVWNDTGEPLTDEELDALMSSEDGRMLAQEMAYEYAM